MHEFVPFSAIFGRSLIDWKIVAVFISCNLNLLIFQLILFLVRKENYTDKGSVESTFNIV